MYERKFLLRTDYRALLTLFSALGMGRRPLSLHRWSDRLLPYNFGFEYKCSSTNHLADYLSCMHYNVNNVNGKVENDIDVFLSAVFGNSVISVITMLELATCVDSDETVCKVKQYVNDKWPDKSLLDGKIRPYFMVHDELSVNGSGCVAKEAVERSYLRYYVQKYCR